MRKSPIARIALLLALLAWTGRGLTPLHAASTHFDYPRIPVQPQVVEEPQPLDDDYSRQRLVFTAGALDPERNMPLQVNHYQGAAPGPRPFVIVVPIWGDGHYSYPSSKFTEHLRAKTDGRYDVLEVIGDPPLIRWDYLAAAATPDEFEQRAGDMAQRFRLASISIRRMLDWAAAREDLDAGAAGLVGFSMGAIVATIVLGTDDRFAAGAIVMGGARFDRIFANCGGRSGNVRATVRERFGWSVERYQQVFAEAFAAGQPENFRASYDPALLLMMDARFDDCIPEGARDALWRALGRPQRVTFFARHRSAFLAFTPLTLNYGGRKVFRFLRERLE